MNFLCVPWQYVHQNGNLHRPIKLLKSPVKMTMHSFAYLSWFRMTHYLLALVRLDRCKKL